MISFRSAVEAGDAEAVAATLADTVVFRSPVAFRPSAAQALVTAMAAQFDRIEREAAG